MNIDTTQRAGRVTDDSEDVDDVGDGARQKRNRVRPPGSVPSATVAERGSTR